MIILARHGLSKHNSGEWVGATTPEVPLSPLGHRQAQKLGGRLLRWCGKDFLRHATYLESPFLRAQQTMGSFLAGAGIEQLQDGQRRSDPRLSELDFGGEEWTEDLLATSGGIWRHTFASGKSFARDGRDAIAPLVRELKDGFAQGNVVVVTHGWTILTIVMEWFNLHDDTFDSMRNISNCGYVVIDLEKNYQTVGSPVFRHDGFSVSDIHFRQK